MRLVLALKVGAVLCANSGLLLITPAYEIPVRHLEQPAVADTYDIETECQEAVRDSRGDVLVREQA
jgi:hypothetical protein